MKAPALLWNRKQDPSDSAKIFYVSFLLRVGSFFFRFKLLLQLRIYFLDKLRH